MVSVLAEAGGRCQGDFLFYPRSRSGCRRKGWEVLGLSLRMCSCTTLLFDKSNPQPWAKRTTLSRRARTAQIVDQHRWVVPCSQD
jgi:hypothetical protein